MAIFDGKNIKGSLGNLVFSQHGKKTIVKSKPGVGGVKQTAATKKSASIFGQYISPFAKLIRIAFRPIHQNFYDGSMVNRMNSAISTIMYQHLQGDDFDFNARSFQRLAGFDFNINSPLNQSLLIIPNISYNNQQVELYFPSFSISKNIRFPRNYTSCTLQILFTVINIEKHHIQSYPIDHVVLDKQVKEFDGLLRQFQITDGDLAMIGIAVHFTQKTPINHHYHNSKLFHPSGIVSVWLNR